MTSYLLLIQGNATQAISPQVWAAFFEPANQSGMFQGGSQLGSRNMLGDTQTAASFRPHRRLHAI